MALPTRKQTFFENCRELLEKLKRDRATAYHVAQYFLIGLYTGTRAGAICGAVLDQPTIGRSWIDLENGIFYRPAIGRKKQKKASDARTPAA